MDHEEEDCIAVGSTGTLLSLMGKEMEILQGRRSCSVSYNNMNYNYCKSPSAKDPNTLYASNVFFGSPASPLPSTSIVSSLWSDLKGLLRSPTSIYHTSSCPHIVYHNNAAHESPLIYHHNALICKEQLEFNEDSAAFFHKSPSQASPLKTHSHPSPKRTYPKREIAHSQAPSQIPRSPSSSKEIYPKEAHSAAVLDSCLSQKPASRETYPKEKVTTEAISYSNQISSRETYPKEKVTTESISYSNQKSSSDDHGCLKKKADHYPHGKSAFNNYPKQKLAAGAADYPNWKSPLRYYSQERSAIAHANRKYTEVYQVAPTGIDQKTWKGNPPKEGSLAGAAAANPNLHYPKGKAMDAANPSLQYASYPKAKAMDAVYAMRRRLGITPSGADHSLQNDKLLQEETKRRAGTIRSSCSRKRQERAICSMKLDHENCMKKREEEEERGSVQNEHPSMQKREERECMQDEEYWGMERREEERGYSCMQEYECMLQEMEKLGPCTPASASPLKMRPGFKACGGRSLALVSVVDLPCCHTATSRERSSRRLSFTRLSV